MYSGPRERSDIVIPSCFYILLLHVTLLKCVYAFSHQFLIQRLFVYSKERCDTVIHRYVFLLLPWSHSSNVFLCSFSLISNSEGFHVLQPKAWSDNSNSKLCLSSSESVEDVPCWPKRSREGNQYGGWWRTIHTACHGQGGDVGTIPSSSSSDNWWQRSLL